MSRRAMEGTCAALLLMVAVLKSRSAQRRFLHEHHQALMEMSGLKRFPSRSTYFDRYRRDERIAFFESRTGRRLHAFRSRTVEPFNDRLKSSFELGDRVGHRGLDNNQTQLLAAIFCYQLLVRYNHRRGRNNGQN